ncbi:MAG: T9SS type A sorting domain-containing protein [Flavobacteriales bacterium]|nr:T9SS type A sorting domain-containing protein [Flavobacteriales bacterium]
MSAQLPHEVLRPMAAAASPAERPSRLKDRLNKHFRASAKAAAAVAGIVATGGLSAQVVSWIPPGGIDIPLTTAGVYINVETQAFGTAAAAPGWDMNPWSATNLNWFNPSAPAGGVYHVMPGGTGISNLPMGYTIPGTGAWGSGASTGAGIGAWTFNSADNYVGFRFLGDDSELRYGYARVEVGSSFTTVRTILEIHYEQTPNAPITIAGLACAPPTGTAVAVNAGCATYDIQVNVTGTGDSPGAAVDILVDGNPVQNGATVAGSPYTFTGYANGAHTVTLVHLSDAICNVALPVNSNLGCPPTSCGSYSCVDNECEFTGGSNTSFFAGTGLPAAIPDNAPLAGLDVTIPVSGITGTVENIGLNFTGLTHTWVGDLVILLTSPAGTTHTVIFRVGQPTCPPGAPGAGDSSNLLGDYAFNDGAATTLWTAAVAAPGTNDIIPSGTYRTTDVCVNTATSILATFGFPAAVGVDNINGDWTVYITDNAGADVGTIDGLSLEVCWTAPAPVCGDAICEGDETCATCPDDCGPCTPANDDCANATVVGDGTHPFSSINATGTNLSSCAGANDVNDVWFEYVATCTGTATASTCNDATFDTSLAIFDACGGNELACNDDAGGCGLTSSVNFSVVAGQSYWVRIAGFNGGTGTGNLTMSCSGPVANDDCANATDLVVQPAGQCAAGLVEGSTIGATNDGGTLFSCVGDFPGLTDVWYTFNSGSATFIEIGLNIITQTPIGAEVFDACGGAVVACLNGESPHAPFAVTPDTQYRVRVVALAQGTFSICAEEAASSGPSNDLCADAIVIGNGVTPFSSIGATGANESSCAGANDVNDVWFEYVATCTGTATASTCNDATFDTSLAIFDACGGNELACNDDAGGCGLTSSVNFSVVAGQSYWVRIAGFNGGTGTGNLTMSCIVPPPAPENDDCADVTPEDLIVDGAPLVFTGTTVGATTAGDGIFNSVPNVWHSFTLAACANVTFSYCGPVYDDSWTGIAIDCPATDGVIQTSAENTSCGNGNWTTFYAELPAGTYYLPIGNFGPGTNGPYQVTVTATACEAPPPPVCGDAICNGDETCATCPGDCGPCPPANDLCANAIVIGNGVTPFSTVGATGPDVVLSPNCVFNGNASNLDVWFEYVATCTGDATASTCGDASFDTVLSAFDACGGNQLACNDDSDGCASFTSAITFPVVAGQSYWIRVSGFINASGTGNLTMSCQLPPGCVHQLVLELQTDGWPSETSWAIIDDNTNLTVASGGTYPGQPNAIITEQVCVDNGCFRLEVYDSFGDGMESGGFIGGYTLRTLAGDRIIDNRNNFSDFNDGDTEESTLAAGESWCLPLGTDRLIDTSCDRNYWVSGNFIVAHENCDVSAEFGGPNASSSGYEFWFFDPNGGYSFRRFRSHTVSEGFNSSQMWQSLCQPPAPQTALRACHAKLNNWAQVNHLQDFNLYNVRVRGVVAGNPMEYGPACRVTLDPVTAACPPTKLNDVVGHPFFSCGVTRTWGGPNSAANRLYAMAISGANLYEWEFTNLPGEAPYLAVLQTTTVQRHLNWTSQPAMQPGVTYNVRVRSRKNINNVPTWCVWGDYCQVTIAPAAAPGNENMAMENITLNLWPNPNNGQQLWLSLDEVAADVETVAVDIYDLSGKRIVAREVAAQGGHLYTVLDLNSDLAAGMYMVNIIAGDAQYTQRLVIQP